MRPGTLTATGLHKALRPSGTGMRWEAGGAEIEDGKEIASVQKAWNASQQHDSAMGSSSQRRASSATSARLIFLSYPRLCCSPQRMSDYEGKRHFSTSASPVSRFLAKQRPPPLL